MKYDTIFLDLDGVVFDFDRVFIERYGESAENMSRPEFHKNFSDFIRKKQFETLPLCPGIAPMLETLTHINKIHGTKIIILTACGGQSGERVARVRHQKTVALGNTLAPIFQWDDIIFAYNSKAKIDFFKPSAIMIDDYDANIDAWTAAGGTSCWHDQTNPGLTVKTLHELFNIKD